jgi:hypothetical protein
MRGRWVVRRTTRTGEAGPRRDRGEHPVDRELRRGCDPVLADHVARGDTGAAGQRVVQRQRHVQRLAQQPPDLEAGSLGGEHVVRPVRDHDVVVGRQGSEVVLRHVLVEGLQVDPR